MLSFDTCHGRRCSSPYPNRNLDADEAFRPQRQLHFQVSTLADAALPALYHRVFRFATDFLWNGCETHARFSVTGVVSQVKVGVGRPSSITAHLHSITFRLQRATTVNGTHHRDIHRPQPRTCCRSNRLREQSLTLIPGSHMLPKQEQQAHFTCLPSLHVLCCRILP